MIDDKIEEAIVEKKRQRNQLLFIKKCKQNIVYSRSSESLLSILVFVIILYIGLLLFFYTFAEDFYYNSICTYSFFFTSNTLKQFVYKLPRIFFLLGVVFHSLNIIWELFFFFSINIDEDYLKFEHKNPKEILEDNIWSPTRNFVFLGLNVLIQSIFMFLVLLFELLYKGACEFVVEIKSDPLSVILLMIMIVCLSVLIVRFLDLYKK